MTSIIEKFKKLETPIPKVNSKLYWEKYFKELEYKLIQRPLEIGKILDVAVAPYEIDNLKTIVSFYDFPEGDEGCEIWTPSTTSSDSSQMSAMPYETDLEVNTHSYKSKTRKKEKENKANPYWKFCKRPPHKQTPWRPERQQALAPELKIQEKADKALHKILNKIRNFLELFEDKNSELENEATFASLFDLVFDVLAVSTVTKTNKILPSIPMTVAQNMDCLKASFQVRTRQECKWSLSLAKKQLRKMAFGHNLDVVDQFLPPSKQLVKSWETPLKNKDLHTMSTVFRGIENLSSTKAFCNWLYNHPEIRKIAPYLESVGLIQHRSVTFKRKRRFDRLRSRYSMAPTEAMKMLSKIISNEDLDEISLELLSSDSIRRESSPHPEIRKQIHVLQNVEHVGKMFKKIVE